MDLQILEGINVYMQMKATLSSVIMIEGLIGWLGLTLFMAHFGVMYGNGPISGGVGFIKQAPGSVIELPKPSVRHAIKVERFPGNHAIREYHTTIYLTDKGLYGLLDDEKMSCLTRNGRHIYNSILEIEGTVTDGTCEICVHEYSVRVTVGEAFVKDWPRIEAEVLEIIKAEYDVEPIIE